MTPQARMEHLKRRILRARREVSSNVLRISPDNQLIHGSIGNLVHLHADLVELKGLMDRYRVAWEDLEPKVEDPI